MIPVAEAAPGPGDVESPLDRARRKAYWRLIPLCFISYVIAYVDRSNVAIAKLTMTRDLPGFDNAVIGFGAGVFFIGYFLLEIPGTLIVEKWVARKWIARIRITWGIVAALTALVKTPFQFYVVRFLLGLAEAGFYPGVIVYLTHWFARRRRAHADPPGHQPQALEHPAQDRHGRGRGGSDRPPSRGLGTRRMAVDL